MKLYALSSYFFHQNLEFDPGTVFGSNELLENIFEFVLILIEIFELVENVFFPLFVFQEKKGHKVFRL